MNRKQNYTFDITTRYSTRGINVQVPVNLQVRLWDLVDKVVKSKVRADYLQIFTFERTRNNKLRIMHKQEQPEYHETVDIPMVNTYIPILKRKIYVIDDIDHSTMLFANEY